jgi:hypothetical protein
MEEVGLYLVLTGGIQLNVHGMKKKGVSIGFSFILQDHIWSYLDFSYRF